MFSDIEIWRTMCCWVSNHAASVTLYRSLQMQTEVAASRSVMTSRTAPPDS